MAYIGNSVVGVEHPSTSALNATTGAFTGAVTANAGVVVDNITIDGTEIDLSSGSLTVDVAGDLILDADGGGFLYKDGGTEIGRLFNSSSDFIIKSIVSDKDLKIQGNDGGATINALVFDMSAAGSAAFNAGATFADDISFPDNAKILMGAGSDLQIYHDGSDSHVADNGTGRLLVRTNGTSINFFKDTSETMAVMNVDGAVELYHNNAKKIETTSTGVDVTGIAVTDGLTSSAALDVTTSTHANASVFKSTGETQIMLQDTNASSDDQFWGLQVSGGTLNFLTCDDDRAGGFVTPFTIESLGNSGFVRSGGVVLNVNRNGDDGALISLQQGATTEGLISVSGTTVTYAGGHLARWSRLSDNSKDTSIVKGTVMTNLDQMVVWTHAATDDVAEWTEDNEQLNCTAVSSVEGDPNVAGVFVSWDNEDDYNDFFVGMTGDMVIRIANGTTVTRGDLLMSAGDGTAKPQGDDIVRSKTIAKVTSTTVSHTYDDGTFLVPCVLMAC